ncbi:MAG: hypothetical protein R3C68_00210 [Myxococcota bacterium]
MEPKAKFHRYLSLLKNLAGARGADPAAIDREYAAAIAQFGPLLAETMPPSNIPTKSVKPQAFVLQEQRQSISGGSSWDPGVGSASRPTAPSSPPGFGSVDPKAPVGQKS